MQVQAGRFFMHAVFVIFRIMPTKKSPGSLAHCAVDVLGYAGVFILTHHKSFWLYQLAFESRGLAHKTLYSLAVIPGEHTWNRIPLGRKLKEFEVIILFGQTTLEGLIFDVRKFILHWFN